MKPESLNAIIETVQVAGALHGQVIQDVTIIRPDRSDDRGKENMPAPKKFYIAGPMTGYPELNYPAFAAASATLRERGFIVISPAELNPIDTGYQEALQKDIAALIECDGICLLEGWEKSKGASLENHIASALGMEIFTFDDLKSLTARALAAGGVEEAEETLEVGARYQGDNSLMTAEIIAIEDSVNYVLRESVSDKILVPFNATTPARFRALYPTRIDNAITDDDLADAYEPTATSGKRARSK